MSVLPDGWEYSAVGWAYVFFSFFVTYGVVSGAVAPGDNPLGVAPFVAYWYSLVIFGIAGMLFVWRLGWPGLAGWFMMLNFFDSFQYRWPGRAGSPVWSIPILEPLHWMAVALVLYYGRNSIRFPVFLPLMAASVTVVLALNLEWSWELWSVGVCMVSIRGMTPVHWVRYQWWPSK